MENDNQDRFNPSTPKPFYDLDFSSVFTHKGSTAIWRKMSTSNGRVNAENLTEVGPKQVWIGADRTCFPLEGAFTINHAMRTAELWSAGSGDGMWAYSFSSLGGIVHDEQHRSSLIAALRRDLKHVRGTCDHPKDFHPNAFTVDDERDLLHLLQFVRIAPIGEQAWRLRKKTFNSAWQWQRHPEDGRDYLHCSWCGKGMVQIGQLDANYDCLTSIRFYEMRDGSPHDTWRTDWICNDCAVIRRRIYMPWQLTSNDPFEMEEWSEMHWGIAKAYGRSYGEDTYMVRHIKGVHCKCGVGQGLVTDWGLDVLGKRHDCGGTFVYYEDYAKQRFDMLWCGCGKQGWWHYDANGHPAFIACEEGEKHARRPE